jgi:hypothetical protein
MNWNDIDMKDVIFIETSCKNCGHVNSKYNTDNLFCVECGKEIFTLQKDGEVIKMNKRKETRIEVIMDGKRKFVKWNCEIEESIQDNGRTIKLFIKQKAND